MTYLNSKGHNNGESSSSGQINQSAGITEADTFFLAYETTRDKAAVNEKAKKVSLNVHKVSIISTVSDSLNLNSISNCSHGQRCNNPPQAKRGLSNSSCGRDRGCSLAKRLQISSKLNKFHFYDTIIDSVATFCHVVNNLHYTNKN